MIKTTAYLLIVFLISTCVVSASEEEMLNWHSVVIQCGTTPEAGTVACEIRTEDTKWQKFTIQAFGKTHALPASDLKKLSGFPLSSLRTSHEAGYEILGGYTVHFRFARTFYNPEKKLVTETIYVSVTKNGVTVEDPRTKEH
jgi:hypothetical protein